MDDIPQDVLYEAHQGPHDSLSAFLRVVAQHHADRAERLRSLRKKSWQSNSRELDGVADHIRAYADQLEAFAANNPSVVSIVDDEPVTPGPEESHVVEVMPQPTKGKKKDAPQLPGNTGRCASFRRADADDPVVCAQIRGHGGDHMSDTAHHGPHVWPQKHSGHVCGDVVILPDGTALNCARPLGHGGDEHHDGAYRLWLRGVGTSRQVDVCERCNHDRHNCPGCGAPVGHFTVACDACKNDPAGSAVMLPPIDDELFPGQCTDRNEGERCMLPSGHTGRHKGRKGGAWVQVHSLGDAPSGIMTTTVDTLGDIAEQQRATMVIPEQRQPEDVPAAVLVAEMKEEVSATVAELTGDEPIGTTVNVGGIEFVKHSDMPFGVRELEITSNPLPQLAFTSENGYSVTSVLSNPFVTAMASTDAGPTIAPPGTASVALSNPFQTPAPPPAAFLPPHLVPGAPKADQSHSSITRMEKCGLQYRLHYRDGIGDDTPAWWNVAGTAFHTVVQTIEAEHANSPGYWATDAPLMAQEREAATRWRNTFEQLVEQTERESGKARSTWKAAKGGKEGEAFWREYGGDLARMYVAHRRRFLAEPEGWRLLTKPGGEGWAHEVEFRAMVDGVELHGFLDAAWISADGMTILIEDFKSGSSEGDPFQPKLYGAALRALGFVDGRRIIGRFYEARKGAHGATMELTSADDTEVSYRANTAQQMDRAGIFPANPSGYNCSTCPVRSRCPIMASKS